MNDTKTEELTIEEDRRIRDFISKMKQEYLNSPTYVEVGWDDGIYELDVKCIHRDWWEELNGDVDEDDYYRSADRYYNVVEKELASILRERAEEDAVEELDCAMEILPGILQEFAIAKAPFLSHSNLETKYREQLRQFVASLDGEEWQETLMEWLCCLDRSRAASETAIVDDYKVRVPVEFVLHHLENCVDVLDSDYREINWDNLGLSKDATYADAVAFARKRLK
jgi:hypothetical protein